MPRITPKLPNGAIRLFLGKYALQAINSELRRSAAEIAEGCETGGWLWAEQDLAWWSSEGVEIVFASGPGQNAKRAPGALNVDTDELDLWDARFREEGQELIGMWHVHPRGDDQPSEPDDDRISALLHQREELGCRTQRALELILTPAKHGIGEWDVHPWIFHRSTKPKRATPAGRVCPAEPAIIVTKEN